MGTFQHKFFSTCHYSLITLESLHDNAHQRETIYKQLMFFTKIDDKAMKVKSKQNLNENVYYKYSYIPIQNLKSLVKTQDFECQYTRTLTKSNSLKFHMQKMGTLNACSPDSAKLSKILINTLTILLFLQKYLQLNCYPKYFGVYFS